MAKDNKFLFFFTYLFITNIYKIAGECEMYSNKIYQVETKFGSYKPFYFFMLFLPNGVLYEISNIANGINADTLGVDLQFAPHIGFYECLNSTTVHITDFGYIYKSNEVAVLTSNGHFAFHDYYFYFLNNDNKSCVGTLRYKFYLTGTNPFDPNNIPNYLATVAKVTCHVIDWGISELNRK